MYLTLLIKEEIFPLVRHCKATSNKMYFLGVLCLVAFTTALPVIPEPPSLPSQGDVTVHESVLHTNLPIKEDAQKGEHEEKKDENKAEPPQEVVILSLPEPPMLPPFDESILVELIKQDEKEASKVDKENKEEDSKTDGDKNVDNQFSIPKPTALSNLISSLSNFNWSFPISSIKWPSIFTRYPRIMYPGYYIEDLGV